MQKTRSDTTAANKRAQKIVQIAYRQIVDRGFEGLRVRDVAEEVGINNATLHYYFPTKETLIQGVVEYLMQEFQTNDASSAQPVRTAWDALRNEFEDIRYRLREMPEMFIVLTELAVRSRRDPAITRLLSTMEDNWRHYLSGLVEQGIREGTFRPDLEPDAVALTLMAQMKMLGYQVVGPSVPAHLGQLISDMLAQIEGWLTVRKDERRQ